ncbi:hypothetical protein CWI75_10240 [Kineobactrum sediminis]|uniref:Uncharacterized protein n=1 Tax=Kineobactrum sediminis TaxID=1905677 RepID=A0A2N5Y194_9GAMM|nr:DsrE family protein [Kineobactrum sediminis]PLW82162.1 hypothetical protein CWI75_10240 [Kineobactrum sediminis]
MATTARKSVLVVTRHAHQGSALGRSALDAALVSATFELPVTLLFQGQGVLQLLPEQDCTEAGIRNLRKVIESLPLYDITPIYVDAAAAARYALQAELLPPQAQLISLDRQRQLLADHDHILGF